MNEQQIRVACDYINANVRELHGLSDKDDVSRHTGPDIKPENVIVSAVKAGIATIIVDRGIKGQPKYQLETSKLELLAAEQKAASRPVRTSRRGGSKTKAGEK